MAEAPVAGEAAPAPTAIDLIALLDREIDFLQATSSKSGWTLQAALAATGALLWLVLGELHDGYPDWSAAAAVVLGCSCLIDCLRHAHAWLGNRGAPREARYQWHGGVIAQRPAMAASGLRGALLVTTAFFLLPPDCTVARVLAVLYYGLYGAGELGVAFAMIWFLRSGWAQEHKIDYRAGRWRLVVGFALAAAAAVALIPLVPWHDSKAVVEVMRVGGGIAALLCVAVFLAEIGSEKSLVAALADTRRKLVLKQASPAEVARAIEQLLSGLRPTEALAGLVFRVMARVENVQAALHRGRRLQREESALERLAPHTATECRRLVAYARDTMASAGKRMRKLRTWSRVMAIMKPAVRWDVSHLVGQVETAFAAADMDIQKFEGELTARLA